MESRPRRSLSQRVVPAFGLFAFLLAGLSAMTLACGLLIAEDQVQERTLRLEMEEYLRLRALDPDTPLPTAPWLQATFDPAELPPTVQPAAQVPDGFHEVWQISFWQRYLARADLPEDSAEYSMLVHTLDDGRRVYLYFDSGRLEVLDIYVAILVVALVGVILVVTLLGVWIGRRTAHQVIAPVLDLAERVSRRDAAGLEPPPSLSAGLPDDEIGMLARALERSEARSRAFLERERRFTRDASHELRSPVTVVQGALELMESLPQADDPALARPLARIRRASDRMSQLIEAFLWLAREQEPSADSPTLSLAAEIDEIVDLHRHLIEAKPVELKLEVDAGATVEAPRGVLGIVLGNLIANAFFYTRSGTIHIIADRSSVSVTDSGPGIPADAGPLLEPFERGADSSGFGLGLSICRDLCERFGWALELGPGPDGLGTHAGITWFSAQTSTDSEPEDLEKSPHKKLGRA